MSLSSANLGGGGGGLASPTWTTYTPTFTGFGTVATQFFQYMVIGKIMFIHGRFISGTTTATEARVSIPNAASANVVTLQVAGTWICDGEGTNAQAMFTLMEPNNAYLTFSRQGNANGNTSKLNANGFVAAGNFFSISATIPID